MHLVSEVPLVAEVPLVSEVFFMSGQDASGGGIGN